MKPRSITSQRIIGKWCLAAAFIVGIATFYTTGFYQLISWETVAQNYSKISNFIEQNRATSYLGFGIFYIAVVAFSLPIASLLTMAAGALLGWPSIGIIVVAATAGASILFMAARGLFRDVLRARAGQFFDKFEAGFSKNASSYLLFLRLLPVVPFWAANILPAFFGMRLAQFIVVTAIGIIPGTSVYVAAGRGFERVLARGETPDLSVLNTPHILLPLIALALLALLPTLYCQVRPTGKRDESHDQS